MAEGAAEGVSESSWPRSKVPRGFFSAVFLLAPLGVERCEASSSARRRSRSAFFAAASAFFAASSCLLRCQSCGRAWWRKREGAGSGFEVTEVPTYFFALLFAPLPHCSSSWEAVFASTIACFCAAASAFFALPATFLVFSFLGAMTALVVRYVAMLTIMKMRRN